MSKTNEPEIGTIVQTQSNKRGEIVAVWENWQAPGNIHVRLNTGHETRWAYCNEVAR